MVNVDNLSLDELKALALETLDRKNGDRLSNLAEGEEEEERNQTGVYAGFALDEPYGRRHMVDEENGYGVDFGEFICPTAPTVGRKCAIYRSEGGTLFDTL